MTGAKPAATASDDSTPSTPPGQAAETVSPNAPRRLEPPTVSAPVLPFGRIPVVEVAPLVDGGTRPSKAVVGEPFTIAARVFREGHDAVNASAVLVDPDGGEHRTTMHCDNPGLSWWSAEVTPDREGRWAFRVEGWSDPWRTWTHDAGIKIEAGVDEQLMIDEGAILLERIVRHLADAGAPEADQQECRDALAALRSDNRPAIVKFKEATSPEMWAAMERNPLRDLVSPTPDYPLLVERDLALNGAWYEIFPRSEGAHRDPETGEWTSGTLRTAAERLPAIADMGFDVVYLTPIHPIGTTARKGRNNTLHAEVGDPGSPYAIGSPDGGHDAIHPDLGTFEDFDAFVAAARDNGLEVAMDIALQASPDHPWVQEMPSLFNHRADGTIAYAENPPKKYQDIYPLNFDNDPAAAYAEIRRVIQVWLEHGVRIFRVDNPHTKPVQFWQWLIDDVAKDYPETIWLSEAFTKPAMMQSLAKAGFQQSYTYYAWRNSKWELEEYMEELSKETAHYMRPSFWPTTHDILTPYMQYGGPTAWKLRAALAATLVPTYGIYAGYELMEHVARPGAEEQIDNEKYEYKDRHWADYAPGGAKEGQSLAGWLTMLNRIRRDHPALGLLRNWTRHHVDDDNVMAFSKSRTLPDGSTDTVIVVANLDPHAQRETTVRLDLGALGMPWDARFAVHDEVTGADWEWGADNYVRLGPESEPVHILSVRSH